MKGSAPAEQIGRFFRSSRQAQGLSQQRLAALAGRPRGRVSRAMISAIERGRHLPGLEVLLALSQALHVSPREVLERLELACVRSFDTAGLDFEELDRRASQRFWAGDPRGAAACYDAMLRLASEQPASDPDEQTRRTATVEIRRAAALRRCGALQASRAAVEHAIELSDGISDLQSQAYSLLAALHVRLGCLPLARDAAERAVTLAALARDVKLEGWAFIEKGEVLAAAGRWADARRAFLEARRRVRQAGDRAHAVKVEGNIGACLHALGDHRHARVRYQRALVLARRGSFRASEALWLVQLGRLAYDQGRYEEADARASSALRIAKPLDDRPICFRAEWLRHLVRRSTRPLDPDRHRVAYLKKLYARLEEQHGIPEIQEFKSRYGLAPREGERP